MRNIYLSNSLATYRVDLCNALYREYACEIFFFADVPADSCMNVEEMRSRALFPDRHLNVRTFAGCKWASGIRALLDTYAPEVVFVPEFSLLTLQFLWYRRRYAFRLVSFCDDSLNMIEGNDFSRFHRLARRIMPRFLDQVIVSSAPVAKWYRQHFGKGVVMPIIADDVLLRERLSAALPRAEAFRVKYGLAEEQVVLFVGRLVALKNLPVLVEAVSSLDRPVRLVLVGDGVEAAKLKALSAGKAQVLFTGEQHGEDLLAWYQLADVLVLPSTQEAYGAVTGEALTAGCPVVVSRLAGSSDLVREGENGFCFDPHSPAELSQKLQSLLQRSTAGRPLVLRPSLLGRHFRTCIEQLLAQI